MAWCKKVPVLGASAVLFINLYWDLGWISSEYLDFALYYRPLLLYRYLYLYGLTLDGLVCMIVSGLATSLYGCQDHVSGFGGSVRSYTPLLSLVRSQFVM